MSALQPIGGAEPAPFGEGDPDFVSAFARGLAVIQAFDAQHRELSVSEVAEIADVTRAGARRLLYTLVALGFARQNGRTYVLTPKLLNLSSSYLSSTRLSEIARPYLRQVVLELNEFASMSVLDGDDVLYIARELANKVMTVGITVGTRFPAFATATGRVILADLPRDALEKRVQGLNLVRRTEYTLTDPKALLTEILAVGEHGYSWVDEELDDGVRSLAVPIRDREGRVIAAVNVSGSNIRDGDVFRQRALPVLLECAAAIEADFRAVADVADPLLN